MLLEELLLHKEELPIIGENRFQIPIYPTLLRAKIMFKKEMAAEVFRQAATEWYADLSEYVSTLPENNSEEIKRKKWIKESYLNESAIVVKDKYGRQRLGFWEDLVLSDERGFVTDFSISRNAGGSLYLESELEREKLMFGKLIKFNVEKNEKYCINPEEGCNKMFMYSMHNVDYYQGALFLRNWAILYLNEALRELNKEGLL